MKYYTIRVAAVMLLLVFNMMVFAQQRKTINHQSQSWISVNSAIKLKGKWGVLADVHIRRNNFVADPSFYFVRTALNYWHTDQLSFAVGYGHMWVAPTTAGYSTYANENRIFEQVQYVSKIGKLSLLQKVRNEQRWQEIIVNDKRTNTSKFTNRVRYLANLTIPVFKAHYAPSLVLADEVCVQYGKDVVYNTFDQNRVFIGVKETLGKRWSFDMGYMRVMQQKASGYVYDENETFRWFFYYTPDFRKKK